MNIFIEALEKKRRVREEIVSMLSEEDIKRAKLDWHAKRKPRHCGLTIHTGVGCPYQCAYCYIYSMGFPRKISRYPLPPMMIIYALLSNPHFIPGVNGTFLAIGSVTEPFHPLTTDFTIELLRLISKYLGNPTQASTKAKIYPDTAIQIRGSNPNVSMLYSFTTIAFSRVLEPYAPTPEERLESIRHLAKHKVHTTLFVRPIIPGITDKENSRLLEVAAEYGVKRIVYGSLRVNREIYRRLEEVLEPSILRLIKERIRNNVDNRQRYIFSTDIKERLIKEAKESGYKVFPSACSANIDSMGLSCNMCNMGPCGPVEKLPKIYDEHIYELIKYLDIPLKIKEINIGTHVIKIYFRKLHGKTQLSQLKELIKVVSRRNVMFNIT